MKPFSRLHLTSLVVLLIVTASAMCWLRGCARPTTNSVYDVQFVGYGQRGWPIFQVTPNGRPIPPSSAPGGNYVLVLRPGVSTPFVRIIFAHESARGVRLDFAVTKEHLASYDRVTVAVEMPTRATLDDSVLLSNVVELPRD